MWLLRNPQDCNVLTYLVWTQKFFFYRGPLHFYFFYRKSKISGGFWRKIWEFEFNGCIFLKNFIQFFEFFSKMKIRLFFNNFKQITAYWLFWLLTFMKHFNDCIAVKLNHVLLYLLAKSHFLWLWNFNVFVNIWKKIKIEIQNLKNS